MKLDMTVYVAGYKGTDTDDILGVFTDIEEANVAIHKDYESTKFGYEPDIKEINNNHIYIAKQGEWYDEWYIVETELHK
jgi:hypothetical protein